MREKYCWLASGWKLVLERCERKTLLGWRLLELPNRVSDGVVYIIELGAGKRKQLGGICVASIKTGISRKIKQEYLG